MIQRIQCIACHKTNPIDPDPLDVQDGWRFRTVVQRVKSPADHHISMHIIERRKITEIKRTDLPFLICDFCNAKINDGDEAACYTMWRADREPEPGPWEKDYLFS